MNEIPTIIKVTYEILKEYLKHFKEHVASGVFIFIKYGQETKWSPYRNSKRAKISLYLYLLSQQVVT